MWERRRTKSAGVGRRPGSCRGNSVRACRWRSPWRRRRRHRRLRCRQDELAGGVLQGGRQQTVVVRLSSIHRRETRHRRDAPVRGWHERRPASTSGRSGRCRPPRRRCRAARGTRRWWGRTAPLCHRRPEAPSRGCLRPTWTRALVACRGAQRRSGRRRASRTVHSCCSRRLPARSRRIRPVHGSRSRC